MGESKKTLTPFEQEFNRLSFLASIATGSTPPEQPAANLTTQPDPGGTLKIHWVSFESHHKCESRNKISHKTTVLWKIYLNKGWSFNTLMINSVPCVTLEN